MSFNDIRISFDNVLHDIALTYNIDYTELHDKYMPKYFEPTVKKKRGRKKKEKEEFIEMTKYEYKGIYYLIDNNNIIYSNDVNHPRLLGEKLIDGTIKFNQLTNSD